MEAVPGPSIGDVPVAVLRKICAGNLDRGFTPASTEDRKVISELMREVEEHNGMRDAPLCVVCEASLVPSKGKWACGDQSCAKYGIEQKVKK